MDLKEKFYLIVSGAFDRDPIVYDKYPSEDEVIKVIKEKNGESARVEKRYVLQES